MHLSSLTYVFVLFSSWCFVCYQFCCCVLSVASFLVVVFCLLSVLLLRYLLCPEKDVGVALVQSSSSSSCAMPLSMGVHGSPSHTSPVRQVIQRPGISQSPARLIDHQPGIIHSPSKLKSIYSALWPSHLDIYIFIFLFLIYHHISHSVFELFLLTTCPKTSLLTSLIRFRFLSS